MKIWHSTSTNHAESKTMPKEAESESRNEWTVHGWTTAWKKITQALNITVPSLVRQKAFLHDTSISP